MNTNYLAELNAIREKNVLDWTSPSEHVYEVEVGRLTLRVKMNLATNQREWQLIHERAGLVNSGSSESLELAKEEVIMYAIHYVRHGMVGANS